MPLILERKERTVAQQQPPNNQQRLSAIPRPLKHLVLDNNGGGISHASKPTLDTLPLVTPGKAKDVKSIPPLRLQQQQSQQHQLKQHNINKSNNVFDHETPKKLQQQSQKTLTQMDNDPEVAILELVPFSRQPTVNFGNVNLGATRIRYAILRNSSDKQQQMKVISFPKADKGFYIDATEFLIAPKTEICVGLAWTPKAPGGIRESVTLHDVNRMRWRIVLTGTGTTPKPQLPFQSRNSRAQVPRLFRRPSPSKLNRQMISERNKLVFSPYSRQSAARRQPKAVKPLTKLRTPSPNKRSQIVRKILSKQDEAMAIKVQSYCRMYLAKQALERRQRVILLLQSRIRGYLVRRDFKRKREAAITIQSKWRQLVARRKFLLVKEAAIVLQSHLRGTRDRRRYLATLQATVTIQKIFRGRRARREVARFKQLERAVICLQSQTRGYLVRKDFKRKREAAISIQSMWRQFVARKKFLLVKKAAIILQNRLRGIIARRKYLTTHQATITIQKNFRCVLARRELASLRRFQTNVIKLQSQIRGYLVRKDFNRKRLAAITIQSKWRQFVALRKFSALRQAAVVLQSQFRRTIARRRYLAIRQATITIQKIFRGQRARKEFARLRQLQRAIIWLQSHTRGFIVRKQFKRSVEAVFRIQLQSFRGSLIMG